MATHSSTLAWKILWMEEHGWLQSVGLQGVRHACATSPYLTLPVSTFLLLFIYSVILLFQKMFFHTTLFYESFLLSLILSLYSHMFYLIKYFWPQKKI